MEKKIQAKHLSDAHFLAEIDSIHLLKGRWTFLSDVAEIYKLPVKVVQAKAKSMIRRKVITGCACGCRGDFERVKP